MGFGESIKNGFKNYAVFGGVADRSQFWFWILFTQLVSMGLSIVDGMLPSMTGGSWLKLENSSIEQSLSQAFSGGGSGTLSALWGLAVFIPTLSVSARRLRDAGKNPKLLWLYLVPAGAFFFGALTVIGWAFGNPSAFAFWVSPNANYSGWAVVGLMLLGVLVISLIFGILFIVWYAQPSMSLAQGNKYLVQETFMSAPTEPIEPGTTA